MDTIAKIMTLADEYTRLCTFMQDGTAAESAKKAREALRTAVTELASTATEVVRDRWIPMFDALQAESHTLRQQLAEAQALIEASRKQEPTCWVTPDGEGFRLRLSAPVSAVPLGWDALFATPVVAPDVLKDAERYQWLRDNSSSISWNPSRFNSEIVSGFSHNGTGYLGFNFEDAIDKAMEGAA